MLASLLCLVAIENIDKTHKFLQDLLIPSNQHFKLKLFHQKFLINSLQTALEATKETSIDVLYWLEIIFPDSSFAPLQLKMES